MSARSDSCINRRHSKKKKTYMEHGPSAALSPCNGHSIKLRSGNVAFEPWILENAPLRCQLMMDRWGEQK
jgi:hypothetical protein